MRAVNHSQDVGKSCELALQFMYNTNEMHFVFWVVSDIIALSNTNYCTVFNRDETIRSSHDTIRIDTNGDDMVIFDTIRIIIVKIQTFTIFTSFY